MEASVVPLFPEVFEGDERQSAPEYAPDGRDSGAVHQYSEVVALLEEALNAARLGNTSALKVALFASLEALFEC